MSRRRVISAGRLHLWAQKKRTHEVIVSATDGLLGARSTSSCTDGRNRAAAEPEETADIGEGDPKQSAEVVERCGGRLQRGP